MRALLRLIAIFIASCCVLLTVVTAGATAGAAPIQPNEHFRGLVNGSSTSAFVRVACPGPSTAHSHGAVLGNQTFSVVRDFAGTGRTGPFSQVYAWFVSNPKVNAPLAVTITSNHTTVAIPTGVRVPCNGTGLVEFSSCPYLAPCAFGWVPTYVRVTFANVAD